MSNLSTFFGFGSSSEETTELPNIFPINILQSEFVDLDVFTIFAKILTDVIERTHGLKDEQQSVLFDNCVMSESSDGLITMLADSMANKKELFLVYEPALEVLRQATTDEANQIKADYAKNGESSVGVYISFKNYDKADMIKLYSALEYCTITALNKSLNLSNAIQIKMSDLRASVSLADSTEAKTQAKVIARAMSNGKDVLLDSKDEIMTATPDLTSVKESILFLNQKRAFYLGMPDSYISGIQTGGLGTTGENDTKAVERGLKNYYFSIIKPVLEAIFEGVTLSYKSQDFRQIEQALETLKTFDLVGENYITHENKKVVIETLLDLDPDDNETVFEEPEPLVPSFSQPFKGAPSKDQLPPKGQPK